MSEDLSSVEKKKSAIDSLICHLQLGRHAKM